MSFMRWTLLAAAAVGGFNGYAALRRRQAAAAGEPLARWEGEGGAVPVGPNATAAGAVEPRALLDTPPDDPPTSRTVVPDPGAALH